MLDYFQHRTRRQLLSWTIETFLMHIVFFLWLVVELQLFLYLINFIAHVPIHNVVQEWLSKSAKWRWYNDTIQRIFNSLSLQCDRFVVASKRPKAPREYYIINRSSMIITCFMDSLDIYSSPK